MSLELIKLLKSLKQDEEFKPMAEFRERLKRRLMAEVPVTGWFVAWPEFSWGSWSRKLAPAVAGFVVILMGTTVVMAQKSLPIDRLYPVKIASERAAMAIAAAVLPRGHQRTLVAVKIIDRRLNEIKQLSEKAEKRAMVTAVNDYREYLQQTDRWRGEMDEICAGKINRHWQVLRELEKEIKQEPEEKNSPDLPEGVTGIPAIVTPTEIKLTTTTSDNKIDEIKNETRQTLGVESEGERKDDREDKKDSQENGQSVNAVLPEIQITIPVPQDFLSPILP